MTMVLDIGAEGKTGNQDGGRALVRGVKPPSKEEGERARKIMQGSSSSEGLAVGQETAAEVPQDESLDTVFNRRDVAEIERQCSKGAATEVASQHIFDGPNVFS